MNGVAGLDHLVERYAQLDRRAAVLPVLAIGAGLAAGGLAARLADSVVMVLVAASALGLAMILGLGRWHRPMSFVALTVVVVALPDVFANNGLGTASTILILAILASLLFFVGQWKRVSVMDASIGLLFVSAALLPGIVSGSAAALPGSLAVIAGTYGAARLASPSWRLAVLTFLGIGALQATIAILQTVPATASMVPFVPLLNGEPNVTSRATGLYNNPNTLGTVEAMIIALALWYGPTRLTWPVIVLCVAGLLLSGSREAVLGLATATVLLLLARPARTIGPVVLLVVTVLLVAGVVPGLQDRLDPAGYGSDSSLIDRYDLWRIAFATFSQSPWYGHGADVTLVAVDNAYLGWLVTGGLVGAGLWVAGLAAFGATFRAWPMLVVMLAAALLGNPFAGPSLGLLLLIGPASGLRNPADRGRIPPASVRLHEPAPSAS